MTTRVQIVFRLADSANFFDWILSGGMTIIQI